MTTPLFLNGRFFSQAITGVQRFAIETTAAIDRLMDAGEWPDTTILAPRPESPGRAGDGVPPYRKLRLHAVGRTRGQTWEQMELPIAARGGTLINLGNTGPVLFGARQVVVIHDAGVFDTPRVLFVAISVVVPRRATSADQRRREGRHRFKVRVPPDQ